MTTDVRRKPHDPNNPYRVGQKNAQGYSICGAKTRSGSPCTQTRLGASGRCYKHNANPVKGIAHPNYQGKGYSKHTLLPERMRDHFLAALEDDDKLNLESEIALTEARMLDLLSRVDTGEAGALWRQARSAYNDLQSAITAQDGTRTLTALHTLDTVLGRGTQDYHAWDEIHKLMEQKRRLSESRQKHLVNMQQTITAEQAMLLVDNLLNAVTTHVSDAKSLNAIQAEFVRAVNQSHSRAALTSGDNDE